MQLTIEADEQLLRDFSKDWTNYPNTDWGMVAAAIDHALPEIVTLQVNISDAKRIAEWHPPSADNYYGRLRLAARKALGC